MLPVIGTQKNRETLGLVAEWCSRCRRIRPMSVARITQYTHVYWMQVGPLQRLGDDLKCLTCGTTRTEPEVEYDEYVHPDEGADLDELIERTNADLPDRVRRRQEREARLESGEATPRDREEALSDAFEWAAKACQLERVRVTLGVWDTLAFLGIFGVAGLVVLVLSRSRGGPTWVDWLGAALVGAMVIPLGWVMLTERARRCRRRVLPALGDRLWALAPTREEVARRLADFREQGAFIAEACSVDDVLDAAVRSAERWERRGGRR
ncbi:MAG: hypothetical protein AB7K52_11495 [Phycisphaerales bacterium]